MSIIAVRNIPSKGTMPSVVKVLANAIRGEFEALEFAKSNKKDHKICYVRLSEKLDAMQVIETIMSKTKYSAYLPNNVPNLAPASKKGKIPLKTRLRLRIPQSQTPDKVMVETHAEILTELQCKYTGLFNLSKKTGHKLLESIAQTVFERLKEISDTNPEVMETGFMLSKMYRKLHPHFGDFQLILSTLHKLQDAAGVPRLQLAEAELMSASAHPFSIDNVSMDKILIVSNKYTEKIVKKITEHVDSFNLEVADGDSEEEVARKKVREHLKKMSPYYCEIVKQVISNHFIPPKSPFHRVRKTDAGETEELETSGEEEEGDYEIDEEGFHVVADDKEEVKPNTEANAAKLEPVANCSTAEAVVEETDVGRTTSKQAPQTQKQQRTGSKRTKQQTQKQQKTQKSKIISIPEPTTPTDTPPDSPVTPDPVRSRKRPRSISQDRSGTDGNAEFVGPSPRKIRRSLSDTNLNWSIAKIEPTTPTPYDMPVGRIRAVKRSRSDSPEEKSGIVAKIEPVTPDVNLCPPSIKKIRRTQDSIETVAKLEPITPLCPPNTKRIQRIAKIEQITPNANVKQCPPSTKKIQRTIPLPKNTLETVAKTEPKSPELCPPNTKKKRRRIRRVKFMDLERLNDTTNIELVTTSGNIAIPPKSKAKSKLDKTKSVQLGIVDAHRPISDDQIKLLKDSILRQIDSSGRGMGPNFFGYTVKAGWLLVRCVNNKSKHWLANIIKTLTPWEGASLKVIGKRDFPKPVIATTWIPDPNIDSKTLIHRLDAQNGDVDCSHWRVFEMKPKGDGQNVCFAFDASSFQVLWKKDFKMFFNFKTIVLKIRKVTVEKTSKKEGKDLKAGPSHL